MANGESDQSTVLRDGNAGTQGEGIDVITQPTKETLFGHVEPESVPTSLWGIAKLSEDRQCAKRVIRRAPCGNSACGDLSGGGQATGRYYRDKAFIFNSST